MRSRGGGGGGSSRQQHGRAGNSAFSKLLILVLFSAGLIFAYVYMNGSSGTSARRAALSSGNANAPVGVQTVQADTATPRTVEQGQGEAGSSLVTAETIGVSDQRHPNNVQLVISQQSHHDEHKDTSDQASKLSARDAKQGLGGEVSNGDSADVSEKLDTSSSNGTGLAAGAGAGTPGSTNGAKVAAAKGQAGGGGDGAKSSPEEHEIGSGVKATAATLQHATEHLKQATALLNKQALAAADAKAKGGDGAAAAAGGDAAASADAAKATESTNATKATDPTTKGKSGTKISNAIKGADAVKVLNVTKATKATDTADAADATKATEATKAADAAKTTGATSATTKATDAAGAAGTTKVADAAGATAATNASDAAGATAKTPPPDLLAYSKSQNHPGDSIHVLFTSNGSPYQNIQARIMVATFNLVRKLPGGEKLVAMTRILHRTTPDEVMDEIPSFRAQPLQPECDKWCWFPVADRANAVQQWIDAAHKDPSMVKAPWLLLLETDYVWIEPLLAKGSAYDPKVPGLAFRFDYIGPQNPIVEQILKEKCPECDARTVPGSGPAPVLMRFSDLRAATPLWEVLSEWIETHEQAKKQLGWVREMYAWDIGVAANKLNILTQASAETTLIAQPPHDHRRNHATMYHYTWGCIVKDQEDKEVWKFDKRFYTAAQDALKLPIFPEPPPWTENLHVHDGTPWTQDLRDSMFEMISTMNRASQTLPNLMEKGAAAATA